MYGATRGLSQLCEEVLDEYGKVFVKLVGKYIDKFLKISQLLMVIFFPQNQLLLQNHRSCLM